MKRAGIILLVLIYSMSAFGVTFKEFYCCGQLKSVNITVAQSTEQKGSDDGCCKTRYQSFKVKDHHVGTPEIIIPGITCIDLIPVLAFNQVDPVVRNIGQIHKNHDPPQYRSIAIYIFNCVLTI